MTVEIEPGGRAKAPGDLALVQAFINSTDIEAGTDEFATPEQLRAWLENHKLISAEQTLGEEERLRLMTFREALRDWISVDDSQATTGLNELIAGATSGFTFDGSGVQLKPVGQGIDGAVAQLLAIIFAATISGEWERMKVCQRDICRWVFYDASKNHSGRWCSMAVCGSRVKARSYRRRKAAGE